MSRVSINTELLDNLADSIASKFDEETPLTLEEMRGVITDIPSRSSSDLSASEGTITVPAGYYGSNASKSVISGSVTAPGSISGSSASVTAGTNTLTFSKTISVIPNVTIPGYISSGTAGNSAVSLTANVSTRGSSDLSSSGDTVTVPAGYYGSQVTKAVEHGSITSVTAAKGTVSNHSITVTPSATISSSDSGYISSGTTTGNSVTVDVSELVSGNYPITSNGTGIDISEYATVSVDVDTVNNQDKTVSPSTSQQSVTADSGYSGLGTVTVNAMPMMTLPIVASSTPTGTQLANLTRSPSNRYINIPTGYNDTASCYKIASVPDGTEGTPQAVKGSVSNHSISVTPRVTNVGGYIVGGAHSGTAVTVKASDLVSGSETKTSNGTYDVTNLAELVVDVPGIVNQDKTVTPTTSQQSVTADSGYSGLGTVTVNAIPSQYIIPTGNKLITASGITDVTAYATASVNGITLPTEATTTVPSLGAINATIAASTSDQYLTIPKGFNDTRFNYKLSRMPIGTFNNPTATKGTVSNNSVSVTPSVTIGTGYISGSTKSGTPVTVSASELVSGTLQISSNATGIDVTNYAAVDVSVGSTINNQNKTVTPTTSEQSISADSGYTGLGVVTVEAMPEGEIGTLIRTIRKTPAADPTSFGIMLVSNPLSGGFVPGYFGSFSYSTSLTIETKSVIPSTSVQEITPTGNGYYLDKVTVAAMPNLYLPSYVANYSSGTQKLVITPNTSTQYLNISTGYNSTASYYQIDPSLAYEEGTFTPSSDISRPSITFSNTHSTTPAYAAIFDISTGSTQTTDSISFVTYSDPYRMFGGTYAYAGSDRYATATAAFKTSTGGNAFVGFTEYSSDDSGDSTKVYSRYWATETEFRPWANSDSRYFRSGRTYKWIAIWK